MTDPILKRTAQQMTALADPTRLLILRHLMLTGPACVTDLAGVAGVVVVNASHHLGVMRSAGLLVDRRDGRKIYYSLAPDVLDPAAREGVLAVLRIGHLRVSFPTTLPRDAAA